MPIVSRRTPLFYAVVIILLAIVLLTAVFTALIVFSTSHPTPLPDQAAAERATSLHNPLSHAC